MTSKRAKGNVRAPELPAVGTTRDLAIALAPAHDLIALLPVDVLATAVLSRFCRPSDWFVLRGVSTALKTIASPLITSITSIDFDEDFALPTIAVPNEAFLYEGLYGSNARDDERYAKNMEIAHKNDARQEALGRCLASGSCPNLESISGEALSAQVHLQRHAFCFGT